MARRRCSQIYRYDLRSEARRLVHQHVSEHARREFRRLESADGLGRRGRIPGRHCKRTRRDRPASRIPDRDDAVVFDDRRSRLVQCILAAPCQTGLEPGETQPSLGAVLRSRMAARHRALRGCEPASLVTSHRRKIYDPAVGKDWARPGQIDADRASLMRSDGRYFPFDLDRYEPATSGFADGDVPHLSKDRPVHHHLCPSGFGHEDAIGFDFHMLRIRVAERVVPTLHAEAREAGASGKEVRESLMEVEHGLLQRICRNFLEERELPLQLRNLVDLIEREKFSRIAALQLELLLIEAEIVEQSAAADSAFEELPLGCVRINSESI